MYCDWNRFWYTSCDYIITIWNVDWCLNSFTDLRHVIISFIFATQIQPHLQIILPHHHDPAYTSFGTYWFNGECLVYSCAHHRKVPCSMLSISSQKVSNPIMYLNIVWKLLSVQLVNIQVHMIENYERNILQEIIIFLCLLLVV